MKAHDVTAEQLPDKPLDRATHALLAQQLVAARAVAMQYPTVADADRGRLPPRRRRLRSGKRRALHRRVLVRDFDPSHPLALIYDGIHPDVADGRAHVLLAWAPTPPAGFAGPNDHWHRHSGVCLGKGSAVLFPPDST